MGEADDVLSSRRFLVWYLRAGLVLGPVGFLVLAFAGEWFAAVVTLAFTAWVWWLLRAYSRSSDS